MAAAAATWTAGLALVAEHYHEKRVEMMGFALMGSTAGSLVGPLIGGLLYEVGGYHLPFAVTGVLVAVDAGLCVFLLPREQGRRREKSPDLRLLLLDKSVLVAAAAVALAAIGWSIIEPLLPAELERSGETPAVIGVIFTIGSLAYGLSGRVVSWVANRAPIRLVIAGGARRRWPSPCRCLVFTRARLRPRLACLWSASAMPSCSTRPPRSSAMPSTGVAFPVTPPSTRSTTSPMPQAR